MMGINPQKGVEFSKCKALTELEGVRLNIRILSSTNTEVFS
jgi:hypothetical protein